MSNTHSTRNSSYSHLSATERGEIAAYLKMGKKPIGIARLLGRHRSTICREIKRGSVDQVQDKNGKRTYFSAYFADSGQRVYETNRQKCSYLKLNDCSARFIEQLGDTLKANIRLHSVDSFVQTYKASHPEEVVPSTKTIYRYIKEGLLAIKPIDLPKMVNIRKRSKKVTKTNRKTLGKSIKERPECINDRSEFGHWEIDLVLGKKTKGEAVILTLVERQTRYALGVKLEDKQLHTINSAVRHLTSLYPIASITADNGSEFSLLSDLEAVDVYFAHPYSSHERGTNQNFNGLLREYIPKGVSLNSLTSEDWISISLPSMSAQDANPSTTVTGDNTLSSSVLGSQSVATTETKIVKTTDLERSSGSSETISTVSEVHSQVSSSSATSSQLSLSTNPSVASSLSATSQSTISSTASTSSIPEALTRVATSPTVATSATIAASEPLVTKEPVTKMVTGKPLYLQYNGPIASNEKIQYAVWGESEGRNDLTWYSANVAGAAYIDLSKHKEYGLYHVHTYKNVSGKMIGIEGGSITISKPWVTPIVKKIASDHYVVRLEQVPGSLSQIKVPVWSEDQGQDDLKWYSAKQVSSDVYEAHIYTANHKNSYGKYQVHVYAQSVITGKSLGIGNGSFVRENIRALSLASVAISHKTGTTATITVAGSSDSKVISRVSVAAWSQTNGQDDLKWYKSAVANQTAQLTVDMRDLSNTTDDYTIHVYTDYADGSRTGTNLGQVHFTKSNQLTKTGNVKITAVNKTTNSFQTIITNASSSEGLKSIRVAVWSNQNGQDDLEWQVATKQADGSYIATTDLAKHAYANDTYHVHVYYELANGKLSGLSGNKTNVSGVMPNLSKIASSIVGLNQFVPTTADRLALEKAIKVIKNQSYDVGFVLYDLATRKGVSYNANKGFYVASAIKAPYVASLAANNKSAFQSYQSTIKDILYYSSNDGYNLLRRTYGGVYMEKWMREAGVNPALAAPGYPYITANEMAKLWERNNLFFQNTTTGKQMASWYERPNLSPIRSMLGSQYNTKSKAGWIGMPGYHAANDAGIVSTPKGRYVLTIMSNADGKLGLLNELVLSLNNIYKSL